MFIKINQDTQLYYQITGSGPTLLFLHGNGEDHTIFNRLVERLKDSFTCIQVDTRCHGSSTGTPPLTYDNLAADIDTFVKSLNIEQLSIVGFSDGAIIGMLLALQQVDYLSSLIAIGLNLRPDNLREKYRLEIEEAIQAAPNDPVVQLMTSGPHISIEDLSTINIPTLLIAADDDLLETNQYEEIATKLPKGSLYIQPSADHTSYVINQAILAPIIQDFYS